MIYSFVMGIKTYLALQRYGRDSSALTSSMRRTHNRRIDYCCLKMVSMTLHSRFWAILLSILLLGSAIKIFAADSVSQAHRFTAEERAYWALKPVCRPKIPAVKN